MEATISTSLNQLLSALGAASGGDAEKLHKLRRSVIRKLQIEERGTPYQRNKLRKILSAEQGNKCHVCGCEFKPGGKFAILDRRVAHLGYVYGNVDLKCAGCDMAKQERLKYKAA